MFECCECFNTVNRIVNPPLYLNYFPVTSLMSLLFIAPLRESIWSLLRISNLFDFDKYFTMVIQRRIKEDLNYCLVFKNIIPNVFRCHFTCLIVHLGIRNNIEWQAVGFLLERTLKAEKTEPDGLNILKSIVFQSLS